MDVSSLTYETFAALVGTLFSARTPSGDAVPFILVDAHNTELAGAPAADGTTRTQFSLVFRGPADRVLEQGSYEFSSSALGTHVIFVVPIRQDADGRYYEAVYG